MKSVSKPLFIDLSPLVVDFLWILWVISPPRGEKWGKMWEIYPFRGVLIFDRKSLDKMVKNVKKPLEK